jgi:adenosylcobinamide-GDP ribazoletransferase
MAEFVHALKFLTRLPVPFSRTLSPPPMNQTLRMFSLAGAFIGLGIAAVLWSGRWLGLPPMLTALFAIGAGLVATGALHEDGFADTADGLGGGRNREHRLEIMRDSRIGSYGTLALIIAIGIRATCYVSLLALPWPALLAVVAACQSFSRGLVVDLLWATGSARPNGLSAMVGQPNRNVAAFAIALGFVATIIAGYFTAYENAILALGLGLAATASIRWLAIRLIGGQTGDICGAAQVACDCVMLTAFVARLH